MKRPLTALLALLVFASTTFAQTGGVRGKVLDDKGAPLEEVAVKMEFQGGVNLAFDGKTNKKGEFMQIGLRPGTWKFTYTKDGFQIFAAPFRIALGDATSLPDTKLVPTKAAVASGDAAEIQKVFGEAVAVLSAGDYDAAIAAFDALIMKNPSLAEAHYNKAFAQFQKKDYEAAESTLKRALDVKPDYSDARVLLSNVYNALGLKDKAVEVISSGSGSDSDPKQLFNLGITLLNSGKSAEAAEAFAKAEAKDPKNAEVQYYLATAALGVGKTDECVARLEKYLAMGPKSDQNKATAEGLIAALKKK